MQGPTVRQRLSLPRRPALPVIPAPGGERRLTPAEVRAMRLSRADIIGARAQEERAERDNALRHVSLIRQHGSVRVEDGWEDHRGFIFPQRPTRTPFSEMS